MTTITALPTPPSRADSTNFSTRGDAFLGALPTFVTEANAVGSEATAAAAAAAASASAAAASQSTASTAAAAVAAQSPVANAAAAAASAAAAAASAAAAAQTSGAVAATTLSASGAVSGAGFSAYLASPPAIGGTTPAAVSATALSYSTTLTGGTGIVNLGSGQFYKDASGNVGIGTTSPAVKLDIFGAQVLNRGVTQVIDSTAQAVGTGAGITLGGYYNATQVTTGVQIKAAKTNATSGNYSFDMVFLNYANGDSNMTERMRIDSSGIVGIGATINTNLGAKLQLPTYEGISAWGMITNLSYYSVGGVYNWRYPSGTVAGRSAAYLEMGSTSNQSFGFYVAPPCAGAVDSIAVPVNAMTILNTGNVGIGTTSIPAGVRTAIASPNTVVNSPGNVYLYTTDTATADYGAQLTLGGSYTGTTPAPFASIAGRFSLGTSGYLQFGTLTSGSLTEKLRITSGGDVTVSTAALLGYGTGSGGTVTQATSKSTAVTLNKPTGQITMNNAALAAGASIIFGLNNTLLSAVDSLIVQPSFATNSQGYVVSTTYVGASLAYIRVTNITGGSLSEAVTLTFAVIKGSTT